MFYFQIFGFELILFKPVNEGSLQSFQLLYQVLECKPMQPMSSASGCRCFIGTFRRGCK